MTSRRGFAAAVATAAGTGLFSIAVMGGLLCKWGSSDPRVNSSASCRRRGSSLTHRLLERVSDDRGDEHRSVDAAVAHVANLDRPAAAVGEREQVAASDGELLIRRDQPSVVGD